MKKYILFKIIFLSLVCQLPKAFAIEEQMKNYRGIRSLSMGGVLYTTGNYAEALFGNPARHSEVDESKFTLLELTAEVNENLAGDSKKLTDISNSTGQQTLSTASELIGKNEHARVQLFTGYFNPKFIGDLGIAIGLVAHVQANLLVNYTTDIDAQVIGDIGPSLGLSHAFFNESLSIGVNMRTMLRVGTDGLIHSLDFLTGKSLKVSDFGQQGVGIDGDIGAFYHIPINFPFMRASSGLTLSNVMQSDYNQVNYEISNKLGKKPPINDRTLNWGMRFDFPDGGFFKAPLIAFEIQNIGSTTKEYSTYKKIHIGGETRFWKYFLVRAGLNQGYIGGGLGIDLPILKLDFGTYGQELSSNAGGFEDRRYLARMSFEF